MAVTLPHSPHSSHSGQESSSPTPSASPSSTSSRDASRVYPEPSYVSSTSSVQPPLEPKSHTDRRLLMALLSLLMFRMGFFFYLTFSFFRHGPSHLVPDPLGGWAVFTQTLSIVVIVYSVLELLVVLFRDRLAIAVFALLDTTTLVVLLFAALHQWSLLYWLHLLPQIPIVVLLYLRVAKTPPLSSDRQSKMFDD